MNQTCCPQYTIKCDATQFQITKSQKKILKKFRNFIQKGEDPPRTMPQQNVSSFLNSDSEEDDEDESSANGDDDVESMDAESANQDKAVDVETKLRLDPNEIKIEENKKVPDTVDDSSHVHPPEVDKASSGATVKSGVGPDPTKPKSKKKKELRKEKALAKLKAAGKTEEDYWARKGPAKNATRSLEELTSTDFPSTSKHKFETRLVNAQTKDETFIKSYQESYTVFKKYQMIIHKESPSKCTIEQFKRFLCNSSLVPTEAEDKHKFGAFHQQYLIDGKIFAVGVIDILPHCVSSVYLYYDPDFSLLSPGTLTSLFEINFTRGLQKTHPDLKYYYMGFYIHSCPKMRYKAKYSPSWLLCPKTFHWVPVEQSLPLLDKAKYSVLNAIEPSEEPVQVSIDDSVVLFENQAMTFRLYRSLSAIEFSEMQEVQEYANLIGGSLSKKILLYRG